MVKSAALPADLGLTQEDLSKALDSLQDALTHWKDRISSSYAAFAVQTATHLLVVNPQSMPHILEEDDDVLLHESVQLSDYQIKRKLYGLHAELVFFEWLHTIWMRRKPPLPKLLEPHLKSRRYPAIEALVGCFKNRPGASAGSRRDAASELDLRNPGLLRPDACL